VKEERRFITEFVHVYRDLAALWKGKSKDTAKGRGKKRGTILIKFRFKNTKRNARKLD
jgi:hypothetical protein